MRNCDRICQKMEHYNHIIYMLEVGFEPTPPKRLRPERSALDLSAIQAVKLFIYLCFYIIYSS